MPLEIKQLNYSLVIIGNSHNPTVITDYFLKESGIVDDPMKDIDRNNYLVTPAVTQLTIRGRSSIVVEPNRLNIQSNDPSEPFIVGQRYCNTLKFIIGSAIGLNFEILVEKFDFDKWFASKPQSNQMGLTVRSIDYNMKLEEGLCNIKVTKLSTD